MNDAQLRKLEEAYRCINWCLMGEDDLSKAEKVELRKMKQRMVALMDQ